jgi:hypothetical protein
MYLKKFRDIVPMSEAANPILSWWISLVAITALLVWQL